MLIAPMPEAVAMATVLKAHRVSKNFSGVRALEDVDVEVHEGGQPHYPLLVVAE